MASSGSHLSIATRNATRGLRPIFKRYVGIVRRSYPAAMLEAWFAVRQGVPIDAFLRRRLGHYDRFAPQDLRPLPKMIRILDGDVAVDGDGPGDVYPPLEQFAALVERRGLAEHVADLERARERELALHDERVARAEADAEQVKNELPPVETKLAALEAVLDAEVAAGTVAPPSVRRSHRRPFGFLRRENVVGLLAWVATVAVLTIESYQFAIPYLDLIGVDSSDLATSWALNPQGVIAGFGFAFAATAMLFAVSMLLVETVHSLWSERHSRARLLAKVALATVYLSVLGATAVGIASFRHELGAAAKQLRQAADTTAAEAADPSLTPPAEDAADPAPAAPTIGPRDTGAPAGGTLEAMTFIILTLTLPLALACVHLKMKLGGAARRAADAERRKAIDDAELAAAGFERHQEIIRPWRERRDQLRTRLDEAERALMSAKESHAKAMDEVDAQITSCRDELREAVANEGRAMMAFVGEAIASLELDRFAFLQCARRRNRHLLSADAARDLPSPRLRGAVSDGERLATLN